MLLVTVEEPPTQLEIQQQAQFFEGVEVGHALRLVDADQRMPVLFDVGQQVDSDAVLRDGRVANLLGYPSGNALRRFAPLPVPST